MLVESPEALNIIKEGHVKSIISLLDKYGRNHKVPNPSGSQQNVKIFKFWFKIGIKNTNVIQG